MAQMLISLVDQVVELDCPTIVAADMEYIFRDSLSENGVPTSRVAVAQDADDLFSVTMNGDSPVAGLTRGDLPTFVMEMVIQGLVKDLGKAVALHAGAVGLQGPAALVAGPTNSGKSSLVAWLVDHGFDYLSDEITVLDGDNHLVGLPRALVLKPSAARAISALHAYSGAKRVAAGEHVMLRPIKVQRSPVRPRRCSLIIFPEFFPNAELSVRSVGAAQAAMKLVGSNLNARNLADGGFPALVALARRAPALHVRYGDFVQLEGVLDVLLGLALGGTLDHPGLRRFLSLFAPAAPLVESAPLPTVGEKPAKKHAIPAATPARKPGKLTIGMATFDDYDGVYFSLQALRIYHPEIVAQTDFLVIDNNPDGPCGEALKALEESTPNYRYVPFQERSGTAASKDQVFNEAGGSFVLCLDCHVFVVPGALRRLIEYIDAHPTTMDLLQGPLLYDDLNRISTHFAPTWRGGMYGCWESDARGEDPDADPFDIPMQGMGLFACRREAWPGFHPQFRGFGGEEGYIHEKFRQRGGRTLCLPFLRWVHRFRRPMGLPYLNTWEDRVRNYLLGFRELGLPTEQLERHYREFLGDKAEGILESIKHELDTGHTRPAAR
jgi:hypothetical protein